MVNILKIKSCCAAFCATFLVACGHFETVEKGGGARAMKAAGVDVAAPEDKHAIFNLMREGGYVLVMRHAASPHDQENPSGTAEGCVLGEGRGLSVEGRESAKMLGELLAKENVPILKAYTSDMCRAWDTAVLTVAGRAPVIPHASQKTTDPETIAAFKLAVEAELASNPGQNIVLANHSNIAPLYGAIERDDEAELPEGVISVVEPSAWFGLDDGTLMRLGPAYKMIVTKPPKK
ncbi:MAG: hypothetical protein HKN14_12375 [Marinicaulis sp.]|nr:histidine phosphatase family protein [Marinicaulis sp.]NNE41699.1 hypothetical protein [Marinicaulis sp.]NNL88984.1 hypothetical protein [Marinicaulis sp.]